MVRFVAFLVIVLGLPMAAMAKPGTATTAPANASPATTGAGKPFQDCAVCPKMIEVPAGSFVMGKDDGFKYERPAHKVTIAKPFAISEYEITFNEWKACFDAGGCGKKMPDDHHWGRGNRPVINITYLAAVAYAKWLAEKTGKSYRLPSEAEWEYAARAGTTTDYFWGNDPGKNKANCRDCGSKWSAKKSAPVGSFAPNPWGIYDMNGNEWEWVTDCWNPSYEGAPTDGSAWMAGDCKKRPMRSGSWYYFHRNIRSSWRWPIRSNDVSYNFTVRVVRDMTQKAPDAQPQAK